MVHPRVYAEVIALGAIILISTTMALSQTIGERFPGLGSQRFIPEKIGHPLAARDLVEDIKQQFLTVTISKESRPPFSPASTTGLGSR
jgi:hypothetical protein